MNDAPVWVRRLASGLNPPVDLTGWIHPGVVPASPRTADPDLAVDLGAGESRDGDQRSPEAPDRYIGPSTRSAAGPVIPPTGLAILQPPH